MTTPTDPIERGTIGLVPIAGEVGKLIRLGQWLAENPVRRWLSRNDEPNFQHAFVYIGEGQVVSAEPGGARLRPTTRWSDIYWCENIAAQFPASQVALAGEMAVTLVGVPYGFLDYFSLFLHRLHIRLPFLKHYIQSSHRLICSQLADMAYSHAGLEIFSDKRWDGDVMPMDLYLRDQALSHR